MQKRLVAASESRNRVGCSVHYGPGFRLTCCGRLLGLIDVAKWGLERVLPLDFLVEFEVSSHAHDLLRAIADTPGATNTRLMDELGVHAAQVSRLGSRLELGGMARKRRAGRTKRWDFTPRGVQALAILDAG